MKPLIEITSVPISIQYQTSPAQIERKNMMAEVEITRDRKGLSIKSRPIQLNIDTFEARSSISPTPMQSVSETAQRGMQAAYNATASIAQQGNMMLNIHMQQPGEAIPKLAAQNTAPPNYDFNIKFVPDRPINLDWIPPDMQINYEMDKLNFDWKTGQNDFEFTPGSIEFVVNERPKVVIEYVGEPIYVPPSSNPNYEPIDTRA